MAKITAYPVGKALTARNADPNYQEMIEALCMAMTEAANNGEGRCDGAYLLDALEINNFTIVWQPDAALIKQHLVLTAK